MTAPVSDQLQQQLEDEAVDYEELTEDLVTAAFAAAVLSAAASFFTQFLVAAGSPVVGVSAATIAALRKSLENDLISARPDMAGTLWQQIQDGVQLGFDQANRFPNVNVPLSEKIDDNALRQAARDININARAGLDRTIRLSKTLRMKDKQDAYTVLGSAHQTVTEAKRTARWSATRALNHGISKAAEQSQAMLLWVPERDACLHCLAYAGRVTIPGHAFPQGLTFATRPLKHYGTLYYPPLHPNCRCRIIPYFGQGPSTDYSDGEYSSRLAAEARRSVLQGKSDSDSEPERIRAADRLIKQGAGLPKTVVARAARSVKEGSFK